MVEKITLYKTPTCFRCKNLKELLDENAIVYQEVMDLDMMDAKGITHVPVLETDAGLLDYEEAQEWIAAKSAEREVANGHNTNRQ